MPLIVLCSPSLRFSPFGQIALLIPTLFTRTLTLGEPTNMFILKLEHNIYMGQMESTVNLHFLVAFEMVPKHKVKE